jgi:hypothetical protein
MKEMENITSNDLSKFLDLMFAYSNVLASLHRFNSSMLVQLNNNQKKERTLGL